MSLLEGWQMGPHGGQTAQSGRSGISPLAMGLLAMLAYKTMKGEGALGGLFSNRPAGYRLQQNGLGDAGRSWVGHGPDQPVSANDIQKANGSEALDALAKEIGISREQLLQRLSAELPQTVDKLTPQCRAPTLEEASEPV